MSLDGLRRTEVKAFEFHDDSKTPHLILKPKRDIATGLDLMRCDKQQVLILLLKVGKTAL